MTLHDVDAPAAVIDQVVRSIDGQRFYPGCGRNFLVTERFTTTGRPAGYQVAELVL